MKRKFIKYQSNYGGQSFKKRDKREALTIIKTFLEKLTVYENPEKVEMTIYETSDKKQDEILITSFQELYGNGERVLWMQHYEGGNEEYCWKWKFDYANLEKCITWFYSQKISTTCFMQPTLTLNFHFKWKDLRTGELLAYQNTEYFSHEYNSQSHLLFFLSKTNSVICDLSFPFEEVNEEFLLLRESILDLLPIDLKEGGFRQWIPKKGNEDYKLRKIKIASR